MRYLFSALLLVSSFNALLGLPINNSDIRSAHERFTRVVCQPNSGITCVLKDDDSLFVDVKSSTPGAQVYRLTGYQLAVEAERYHQARAASLKSRSGDRQIASLEADKDMIENLKIVCVSLGGACVAASGWAAVANPALGILGIAVCSGGIAICENFSSKAIKKLDDAISGIKEACAQGDRACYEEILREKYPEAANPGGGVGSASGDAIGGGSTPPGGTPPAPGTPREHGSEVVGSEGGKPIKFKEPPLQAE